MSESKLNVEAIYTYSDQAAQKINDAFFQEKKVIKGDQIVNLTKVEQVNFFILKILFTKWQQELTRLESPYFDYKDDQVKKSLRSFMNVLSKNIMIEGKDFLPLLKEAICETLLVLLSPYDYYHKTIAESPFITLKYLRSQARYIRINKHLYMHLLAELQNENEEELLEKEYVLKKLDSLFESTSETPEDIDNYLSALSGIQPAKVGDFFAEELEFTEIKETELTQMQNHLLQDFEEMDENAIERSKQQLNDRFANEQQTLNEKMAKEAIDIATAHASKKVENIQAGISINQRYMFVKELFNGDSDSFDTAIEEVNDCDSFEDAVDLLVKNYAKSYDWNMQSVEIKELLKIILKRFR